MISGSSLSLGGRNLLSFTTSFKFYTNSLTKGSFKASFSFVQWRKEQETNMPTFHAYTYKWLLNSEVEFNQANYFKTMISSDSTSTFVIKSHLNFDLFSKNIFTCSQHPCRQIRVALVEEAAQRIWQGSKTQFICSGHSGSNQTCLSCSSLFQEDGSTHNMIWLPDKVVCQDFKPHLNSRPHDMTDKL